jgi:hypothetical protein
MGVTQSVPLSPEKKRMAAQKVEVALKQAPVVVRTYALSYVHFFYYMRTYLYYIYRIESTRQNIVPSIRIPLVDVVV